MKLLIITQKVNKNDQILGFFHRWIEEFAKNVDSLKVICLEKGEFNLPENVEVFSLGKENGVSKIGRLINFYKYIWKLRNEYDTVFVHMNPIYLCVAGLFFKILKKPAFLWYTHKNVDLKLKIAVSLSKKVFTASVESLRMRTPKKIVTGHGIDTEKFKPGKKTGNKHQVITVGRISEVKNIDRIVDLIAKNSDFKLDIIGAPIRQKDFDYAKDLYLSVQKNNLADRIDFVGPVTQDQLPEKYNNAHIFINLSKTGSLDKAILEAMSCGLQVITSNDAAKYLNGVNFVSRNEDISEKLKDISNYGLNNEAREFVIRNHSIESLIPKIVGFLK